MFLRISIAAFFAGAETGAAFESLKGDRRLARCRVTVQPGGIAGAAAAVGEGEPPHLIIVEAHERGEALFEALNALAEACDPASKVIVIGQDNDIELYRRMTGIGISDYLAAPVSRDRLVHSIEEVFSEADATPRGRVIAFMGARGGVGSSTIAANTAYSLGEAYEDEVVVLDLDLPFGTAGLTFNLSPEQGIAETFAQLSRLDEVMLERVLARCNDHLALVSAPARLNGAPQVRAEAFDKLLELVTKMAAFVVIDVPHLWAPWVSQVLTDADEVVVVAYPDLANLRDAKNLLDTVRSMRGVEAPVRLVLNRVGLSKKTELSITEFEKPLDLTHAVAIPFVPSLFGSALNEGVAIAKINRTSGPTRRVEALAGLLSGRKTVRKPRFTIPILRRTR